MLTSSPPEATSPDMESQYIILTQKTLVIKQSDRFIGNSKIEQGIFIGQHHLRSSAQEQDRNI